MKPRQLQNVFKYKSTHPVVLLKTTLETRGTIDAPLNKPYYIVSRNLCNEKGQLPKDTVASYFDDPPGSPKIWKTLNRRNVERSQYLTYTEGMSSFVCDYTYRRWITLIVFWLLQLLHCLYTRSLSQPAYGLVHSIFQRSRNLLNAWLERRVLKVWNQWSWLDQAALASHNNIYTNEIYFSTHNLYVSTNKGSSRLSIQAAVRARLPQLHRVVSNGRTRTPQTLSPSTNASQHCRRYTERKKVIVLQVLWTIWVTSSSQGDLRCTLVLQAPILISAFDLTYRTLVFPWSLQRLPTVFSKLC